MGDGTMRSPLVLNRADLDLTQLRRHCREQHEPRYLPRYGRTMPRSNTDLAGWHWSMHHRYGLLRHTHRGPVVLVRNRRGSTTGQIARPLGWFTGQEMVTRQQMADEFRAKILHGQPRGRNENQEA